MPARASNPDDQLVAPLFRREMNDDEADNQDGKPDQRRHQHSTHVVSPFLRIIPKTKPVKLIPTLQAMIGKLMPRFSTSWSNKGNTAQSTLNSINHTDRASRRASFAVLMRGRRRAVAESARSLKD